MTQYGKKRPPRRRRSRGRGRNALDSDNLKWSGEFGIEMRRTARIVSVEAIQDIKRLAGIGRNSCADIMPRLDPEYMLTKAKNAGSTTPNFKFSGGLLGSLHGVIKASRDRDKFTVTIKVRGRKSRDKLGHLAIQGRPLFGGAPPAINSIGTLIRSRKIVWTR